MFLCAVVRTGPGQSQEPRHIVLVCMGVAGCSPQAATLAGEPRGTGLGVWCVSSRPETPPDHDMWMGCNVCCGVLGPRAGSCLIYATSQQNLVPNLSTDPEFVPIELF